MQNCVKEFHPCPFCGLTSELCTSYHMATRGHVITFVVERKEWCVPEFLCHRVNYQMNETVVTIDISERFHLESVRH